MNRRRRSNTLGGLLLILLGLLMLGVQLVPGVQIRFAWPWIIIGVGLLLFLGGSAASVPALVIPACVIGGIGAILYYQTATGDWDSWAYVWALIPGFVGVGVIVAGVLGGDAGESLRAGGWLLIISLVLFSVFGSFLGALGLVGDYWPVLLIVLGLVLLVGPFVRRVDR